MQERRENEEVATGNKDINTSIIDYQKEKFVALYQARSILANAGTMEERRVCSRQLKRMKEKGIGAL